MTRRWVPHPGLVAQSKDDQRAAARSAAPFLVFVGVVAVVGAVWLFLGSDAETITLRGLPIPRWLFTALMALFGIWVFCVGIVIIRRGRARDAERAARTAGEEGGSASSETGGDGADGGRPAD